jgi:polyvinyl alcohol dehydrogenase (cytochrome)
VDTGAPLIVNGFGFNAANTRNVDSAIDSSNVHELRVNYRYAPANAAEKRGVPAVTAQTIFLTSGNTLIALNQRSGCEYRSYTATEGARPGIYALELATGKLVWEIHATHTYQGLTTPSLFSATLSVSNDVLFAGSLDGVARAFSSIDGTELWQLDTAVAFTDINGVEGNGGTIDSVGIVAAGDGLLINSGYSTFQGVDGRYQRGPGNALFVLSMPQNP